MSERPGSDGCKGRPEAAARGEPGPLFKEERFRRLLTRGLSAPERYAAQANPVVRLVFLPAPTTSLERMVAEVEAGRR
jgi:hypothetical protein